MAQKLACVSCRRKKLKCDRAQPCANCRARSIACHQQVLLPPNRVRKAQTEQQLAASPEPSILASILARLDHIEAYIRTAQESTSLSSPTTVSPTPASESTAMPLGGVSVNDNVLTSALVRPLIISIADEPTAPCEDTIVLPPKAEALRLLQVYLDYIGPYQHILHGPHVQATIDRVYAQIASVVVAAWAPPGTALILAVVALASVLEPLPNAQDLGTALPLLKARLAAAAVYAGAAMDCLEQQRRQMDHGLESVQALLVLQFLISHIEAFSPRSRALLAEAVTVAYSLGLHRVDAVHGRPASEGDDDPMAVEMRRRVWWYLAATDWLVSMSTGLADGAYLVRPQRAATNRPRHLDEVDLVAGLERPLSEPTSMSYVLQRLRIAEAARAIADALPGDPREATLALVRSLDDRLQACLDGLPAFFREDAEDPSDSVPAYIPSQRLVLHLMLHLLRCRLHYPYLTGHPSAPLLAFSRAAGVAAARALLTTHARMRGPALAHSADFMQVQGTMMHLFVGALTLTADLYCNRAWTGIGLGQGTDAEADWLGQVRQLNAAMLRLAGIQSHSQLAAQFLAQLRQLLVRCGLWSPETPDTETLGTETLSTEMLGNDALFEELWDIFVERPSAMDLFDLL